MTCEDCNQHVVQHVVGDYAVGDYAVGDYAVGDLVRLVCFEQTDGSKSKPFGYYFTFGSIQGRRFDEGEIGIMMGTEVFNSIISDTIIHVNIIHVKLSDGCVYEIRDEYVEKVKMGCEMGCE